MGQHYYCERWERLDGGGPSPVLAFRKDAKHDRDGVIVVVGDHFNYCVDRPVPFPQPPPYQDFCGSLVDLVDAAVARGDLTTARQWLGVQGGHGRVSQGWKLDRCIEFWKEGQSLWQHPHDTSVQVQGDALAGAKLIWDDEEWDLFECSLESIDSRIVIGS